MKSYRVYKEQIPPYYFVVKDEITGRIEYSGVNGRDVTQWALDNLTSGRTTKEQVFLDLRYGQQLLTLELSDQGLHIPSYTTFVFNGKLKLVSGLLIPFTIIDTPQSSHDIEISRDEITMQAEIDGNQPNYQNIEYKRYCGILVGDQLHESLKNHYNITVRDIYVHDTISSNILVEADENIVGGNNILLQDLRLENSSFDHNIYLSSGKNLIIDNCTIGGFCYKESIALGSGTGFRMVKDSYIKNCICQNYLVNPNPLRDMNYIIGERIDKTDNITIDNNILNGGGYRTFSNIIKMESVNNTISGNTISGILKSNDSFLINLFRSDQRLYGNSISGNKGIMITNKDYDLNDIIIDNGGILYQPNTINCNEVLRVKADNHKIDNLIVENNNLYGCPNGIWIKEELAGTGIFGFNINYRYNNVHGNEILVVPDHEHDNRPVICP